MEKIDRLRWGAGIAFTAYGVSVGVRVSDINILERVCALLPPGRKPVAKPTVRRLYSLIVGGPTNRSGVRRFNLLYADSARLMRSHDLEETLRQFEIDLELYISDRAPRHTFVHAGVVGWNGRAIVIPGRSHSGKSSLVSALVKAGATYYSDEYAVLDERGRVHPYPIPLAIRPDNGNGPPTKYSAQDLGGLTGVRPLSVGLVLITRYVGGARFRPRRLSAGRAVLELLSHTLPARRWPERVLDTLTQAVGQAVVVRGMRGEAEEAARQILGGDLLGRELSAPLTRATAFVGHGG
jgi:hypothetical protein